MGRWRDRGSHPRRRRCGAAGVGGRLTVSLGIPVTGRVMAHAAEHRQSAFGSSVPVGAAAWLRSDEGIDLVLISARQKFGRSGGTAAPGSLGKPFHALR